jgi:hypothetical protein
MSDFEISEETTDQVGNENATAEYSRQEENDAPAATVCTSQCATLKPDGSHCQARPLFGKFTCYFHDPDHTEDRMAASSRGGARKQRPPAPSLSQDVPDLPVNSRSDAVALLARTINQVLRGTIDPKVANSVGFLVGLTIRVMDTNLLEERLAMLETVVEQNAKRVLP